MNVAVPAIHADLDIPDAQLSFTAVSYSVAFASLLVAFGRTGDLYGRPTTFRLGPTMFTVASRVAGLARTRLALFTAGALQCHGAAMVSPAALAPRWACSTPASPTERAVTALPASHGWAIPLIGALVVAGDRRQTPPVQ